MIQISLNINGEDFDVDVSPDLTLLDLLRELGFHSVKKGCGEGDCGACGVIMDGIYCKSCLVLAMQANGRDVFTVESMGDVNDPHPLQQAFVDEGAVQCGYCIPSMLLAADVLLSENEDPTDDEIKEALDGNLCRCTGYVKQIAAVKKAAKMMREEENDAE
ncbi:(2Fe-2S)-binding protein [Myxococcota bacterium]|nr:(2Fe-2S)-binding protein [Myxococcota bacterium]MBU1380981.1 (2Fe-2S)-binding protein [Myxococcota bacterium]MBU1498820.1 (2Fe-2S)-binding protein [Myxococcota bacterium]